MICDICHKNPATISYTVVVGENKTELYLCQECAEKKGFVKSPNLTDLKELMPLMSSEPDADGLKCPKCGLTYKEFRMQAKFGCSECYKAFEKKIIPLLRKIHGSDQHIGKSTRVSSAKDKNEIKLFELKKRLNKAIEEESYEEAARIRDEIKKWKTRN